MHALALVQTTQPAPVESDEQVGFETEVEPGSPTLMRRTFVRHLNGEFLEPVRIRRAFVELTMRH